METIESTEYLESSKYIMEKPINGDHNYYKVFVDTKTYYGIITRFECPEVYCDLNNLMQCERECIINEILK